jgi:3',5'-cyclic AMP phosphodiesterase CpdA
MWRFVQVSDPHLASQRDGVWNNRFLCTMMPEVMRCLRRDLAEKPPDFILATGDIVSQQTREAMFEARDLMDSLGVPYYPMGGNHDFVKEDSRTWFLEAFGHQLPDLHTYYSFTHKNLHFCILDTWWLWQDDTLCPVAEPIASDTLNESLKGMRWSVPPHVLEWLVQDLKKHRDLPVVVAVHYPALEIPERLRHPDMKDGGALDNGHLLLELLSGFPQVRAIFSGHVHMHFIESFNGIVQVTTGAMPEYPTEYRDVRVFEDRMEIETCSLSDESFAARSLIEGKEWTAGQAQDRQTIIHF